MRVERDIAFVWLRARPPSVPPEGARERSDLITVAGLTLTREEFDALDDESAALLLEALGDERYPGACEALARAIRITHE